jgi:hypothetical protein
MSTHDLHAYKVLAHRMSKIPAYEVHTYGVFTYEVYAHKMSAHRWSVLDK